MKISLVIKGKLPSLNEFIAHINKDKFIGNSYKRKIEHDIQMQILAQIREQNIEHLLPLKNIADFKFTYVEKNRKRDKDNIASCKKFLFDAMVARGVINNDGWKWVGRFEEDFLLGEEHKVIIEITERDS